MLGILDFNFMRLYVSVLSELVSAVVAEILQMRKCQIILLPEQTRKIHWLYTFFPL